MRTQRELSTLKIGTKMSTHRSSSQHFPTCSTVPTLRLPETPADVDDHNLPVSLDLPKDAADRLGPGADRISAPQMHPASPKSIQKQSLCESMPQEVPTVQQNFE